MEYYRIHRVVRLADVFQDNGIMGNPINFEEVSLQESAMKYPWTFALSISTREWKRSFNVNRLQLIVSQWFSGGNLSSLTSSISDGTRIINDWNLEFLESFMARETGVPKDIRAYLQGYPTT
jgi:hypothetical protein